MHQEGWFTININYSLPQYLFLTHCFKKHHIVENQIDHVRHKCVFKLAHYSLTDINGG